MAGGKGTRLFGVGGVSKALLKVGGKHLIEYILSESIASGIREICVIVRHGDKSLIEFLDTQADSCTVKIIETASDGTMAAVLLLAEVFAGSEFVLSTCDVIAPSGTLALLAAKAESAKNAGLSPLVVFLATQWVHDETPIWLEADGSGRVVRYGKGIKPASRVFGNVRWCSTDFLDCASRVEWDGINTDTQLMAAMVRGYPGRLLSVSSPGRVFDVDDFEDLRLAEQFLRRAARRS